MDPNSPTFGRPAVVAEYSTEHNGEDVNTTGVCPAALGTKDQQPTAYSPKTGLMYVPTNHVCMDYEPFRVSYAAGQPYVGATLSMFPAPDSHGGMGNFIAWDPIEGRDQVVAAGAVLGLVGRAGDRGRRRLLRHARGLPEGGRLRDRRGALQVQDPVRDHRQRLHLRARGQAVRRRPLGRRRLGRHRPRGRPDQPGERRGWQNAAGRATGRPESEARNIDTPASARWAAMRRSPTTPHSAAS